MKIVLTQTEIKQMVARTIYRDVSDFELEIVPDQAEVSETQTEGQTNEEWWTVPSDWDKDYCPLHDSLQSIEIEIESRKCVRTTGLPDEWSICWVQLGLPQDIVRYRIAKNA